MLRRSLQIRTEHDGSCTMVHACVVFVRIRMYTTEQVRTWEYCGSLGVRSNMHNGYAVIETRLRKSLYLRWDRNTIVAYIYRESTERVRSLASNIIGLFHLKMSAHLSCFDHIQPTVLMPAYPRNRFTDTAPFSFEGRSF